MLLPMFEWLNDLSISRTIDESGWISPLIQAFHLVALAVLMGAVLVVDLRLLGAGLTAQPITRVARGAWPWLVWSVLAMAVTGVPQLMTLALKEYYSDYFWLKMYFLAAALVFTFTIRRGVTSRDDVRQIRNRLVGLTSILLWSAVAVSARLIGLF